MKETTKHTPFSAVLPRPGNVSWIRKFSIKIAISLGLQVSRALRLKIQIRHRRECRVASPSGGCPIRALARRPSFCRSRLFRFRVSLEVVAEVAQAILAAVHAIRLPSCGDSDQRVGESGRRILPRAEPKERLY